MFEAIKQHATGKDPSKQRHESTNFIEQNPLLITSQKGTEDMMAPM